MLVYQRVTSSTQICFLFGKYAKLVKTEHFLEQYATVDSSVVCNYCRLLPSGKTHQVRIWTHFSILSFWPFNSLAMRKLAESYEKIGVTKNANQEILHPIWEDWLKHIKMTNCRHCLSSRFLRGAVYWGCLRRPSMTQEGREGVDWGLHSYTLKLQPALALAISVENLRWKIPPVAIGHWDSFFWLVVEPTHLKNMLVKLEIFPK